MKTTQNRNIGSVAWSDHIIFGEGDGRLDTVPALRRRMRRWKTDFGANIVHWRCTRDRINGKFFHGRGYKHFAKSRIQALEWDDFKEAPKLAHDLGMKIFLIAVPIHVTLFMAHAPGLWLLAELSGQIEYECLGKGLDVRLPTRFSKTMRKTIPGTTMAPTLARQRAGPSWLPMC